MLSSNEENALRQVAEKVRKDNPGCPNFERLAKRLEAAADAGDDVAAAETATDLITETLGVPPIAIKPRRRFLCG